MRSNKLITMFLIFSLTIGCSPATVTPSIQASPTEAIATPATLLIPSATVTPSATLEPDSPAGCINLGEYPLDKNTLNGLLIIRNVDLKNLNYYFLDLRERFLSGRVRLENDQIQPNLPDRPQVYRMAIDFGLFSNPPDRTPT